MFRHDLVRPRFHGSFTAGCGLLALVLPISWAFAQSADSSSATATADDAGKLEEIVVTAEKRSENLEKVPISVQVVGGQMLAEENFNTLQDLTEVVPAVHIDTGGIASTLSIRGVSSGSNSAFDQSVSTFEDDIYHGRSRMSGASFLDLDRIEILKGPQSTYFGNNAIAGALNIVTKKPGDSFDASARVLYGQYGQYALEGAIGGPVTDTLGVRLAVTRNGGSGWIENVNTGRDAPDVNNEAARLTVVFKPVADLEATLKIEGSENRQSGTLGGLPSQWTSNCPAPEPFTATYAADCAQEIAQGLPRGLNNDRNSGLPGQYQNLSTVEDVLTVKYQVWGHTFTSVSGYSNYHFSANWDQDQSPVATIASQLPESYNQFSEELRVASPVGQAIEYQAGAYFQTDRLNFLADSNVPSLNFLFPVLGIPAQYAPLAVLQGFSQGEHVDSVFGSLRWNATDRLSFNAGLRGTWVSKAALGDLNYGTGTSLYGGFVPMPAQYQPDFAGFFGPAGNAQYFNRTDHAWMPSAGVQYQFTPEAMGYLTYNRGFLAGGINGQNGLAAPGLQNEFAPEFVNAYELGIKSKWLDDRLLLNVDVFFSEYQNLQVNTLLYNTFSKIFTDEVGNAAVSRSQGVEFESRWVLTNNFRLGANVTYLESYYISYSGAPPTTLQTNCNSNYVLPYCAMFPNPVPEFADLNGQATQYAPRWSGSVDASYAIALSNDLKLTTELSPYFTSSYNKDPQLESIGLGYLSGTPGYVRLDGKLTLATSDHHWAVDVIGKNLANRIIANESTPYQGFPLVSKQEPRNIAVQFRYHY